MQDDIDNADAVVVSDPLPTVKGDKIQLVQLFQNLIENALKFRSKERPRVYMSVKPRGRHWVFSYRTTASELIPSLPKAFSKSSDDCTIPKPTRHRYGAGHLPQGVERHGGRSGWIVVAEWAQLSCSPCP